MFHAGLDATLELSLTFTPAQEHQSDFDFDRQWFSENLCMPSEKQSDQ